MWTHEELLEIHDRAVSESNLPNQNFAWRYACITLAAAAEDLLSLTERISTNGLTVIDSYQKGVKPQQANVE